MKLSEFLPNVILEKEILQMDLELRNYETDSSLQFLDNKYLMAFWNKVIELSLQRRFNGIKSALHQI